MTTNTGATPRTIDRRSLLRYGAFGAGSLAASTMIASCSDGGGTTQDPSSPSGVEGVEQVQLGEEVADRSEEHTSELQSLMRISYAVFCLKKKKQILNII